MSSLQDMQRVDRKLFSELVESPINPAFLHISTPLKGYDPRFHLQINGEALWKWRVIKSPDEMFDTLHFNLYQIGYQLSSSCRKRVGLNVYSRTHYITNKVRNTNSKKCRDATRASNYNNEKEGNFTGEIDGPSLISRHLIECRTLPNKA